MRCSHQLLEDAAVSAFIATTAATGLEQQQLFLQRAHALEPCPDLLQLFLHKLIHVRVWLAWSVQRAQQPANIDKRHLQRAAVTNEGKTFQVGACVVTVTVVLPGRRW